MGVATLVDSAQTRPVILTELAAMDRSAFTLALRLVGTPEDAEDVVQQAYLNACRSLHAGPPPRKARPWFLRAVANEAKKRLLDTRQRARREAAVPPREVNTRPEVQGELITALRTAIAGLESEGRALVALCYEQGCSQREAAAILDLPQSTLSRRLAEVIEELRLALRQAGHTAAPAVVIAGLQQTAPAVPASLAAFLRNLPVTGTVPVSGAAPGPSLALGWKMAAATVLAATLGLAGLTAWKSLRPDVGPNIAHPPAAGPAAPGNTPAPRGDVGQPAPEAVTITPRGADAIPVFEQLWRQGVRVILLGRQRSLRIPADLRFRAINGLQLVRDLAESHELKVVWMNEDRTAILQAGVADGEVERLHADLSAAAPETRLHAAWRAGWVEDVRVIPHLLRAARPEDDPSARCSLESLRRLGWAASLAVEREATFALLERELATFFATSEARARRLEKAAAQAPSPDIESWAERSFGKTLHQVAVPMVAALAHANGERSLALLKKALGNQDLRPYALESLGRLGGEQAWVLIEKALDGKEGQGRGSAVNATGWMPEERGLPLLETALNDPEYFVRYNASAALWRIGGEGAFAILDKASRGERARREAVGTLGVVGVAGALPLLERFLRDRHLEVRRAAVIALGHFGGQEALALIESALADPGLEEYAIRALGNAGGERAAQLLDLAIRRGKNAAAGLADLGGEQAWAILEGTLAHEDRYRRAAAIEGLGQMGGKRAVAALRRVVLDKEEWVRWAACRALADIGGDDALEALKKPLKNHDFSREQLAGSMTMGLQMTAAQAIGQIGGEKALPLLEKALRIPEEAHDAAWCLAQLGGPALAIVQRSLNDPDVQVRRNAAYGLGHLDIRAGLPLIEKTLVAEKEAYVRRAAASALHYYGREAAALELLTKSVFDEDSEVRRTVAWHLGQHTVGEPQPVLENALKDPKAEVRWKAAAALAIMDQDRTWDLVLAWVHVEKDRHALDKAGRELPRESRCEAKARQVSRKIEAITGIRFPPDEERPREVPEPAKAPRPKPKLDDF